MIFHSTSSGATHTLHFFSPLILTALPLSLSPAWEVHLHLRKDAPKTEPNFYSRYADRSNDFLHQTLSRPRRVAVTTTSSTKTRREIGVLPVSARRSLVADSQIRSTQADEGKLHLQLWSDGAAQRGSISSQMCSLSWTNAQALPSQLLLYGHMVSVPNLWRYHEYTKPELSGLLSRFIWLR